ncbi:LOW QUALITY PROTEIN: zinc finger protein 638-like [Cottoperca gobio]|uniref:LOW QUALITY PROTEIN: zinc finger protein 638-like n=1 Tax=Cottoperca gobio TaxID=56716 RepID=A0A6J2Q607_COTGO|nr:LOW QUALITY PROTEIN: zinc finger protein 638-like [Cottoperca gobio]
MYHHHHSQQQGSQPFSNGPRPPHHQPPPNQHQNRSPSNMLSMDFQFPRPTQLPDELESALAIRGARDMDHRLIDHMNRPNQHQNQGSGSGISQHGSYGSNPITLTSDNQPGHQQGVDWSNYQPPTKLFASPPPSASHQSQRHQGPQQQPQSSHAGPSIPSWTAPVSGSAAPQARHLHGGVGGGGDGQALYTPESAGSILASFGLSNEDLEVLSHYPDDQLTPDTLPFILHDIQINKSGNQKTVASTSSSSFSRGIHDMPPPPSHSSTLARSRSPEVPSLLTVTQTAGKVIDYGHASRAKDENTTRETFKREPLSSERTVKMYPSSSSSSAPKLDKVERRQVRSEHSESSKHGDRDYRRTGSDHRKSNRASGREFPQSSKSRNLDQDYRRDGPKPRPSSETKSEASSRQSLSSSSGLKPHSSSKKLPTPTMISDFSAVSPKVYPHTCSLCHTQCDQEKNWVDHINTVNHTAACRDLRNKYPDWKPNLPRRSGRYGSRALWDPKDHSPSHSVSPSLSCSPTPSPPQGNQRVGPHRPHTGPYSPHHQPRHQHYTEHSHRLENSPSRSHQISPFSRGHWPEKRDRESSGGSSRSGVKRPYDDTSRHPFASKAGQSSKYGPLQSFNKTVKSGAKPGTKATKTSAKLPPAKKKNTDWSFADRLVYLTGIPKDASEQEVIDLVGSFGKINNVTLMPGSEEESNKEGQKASVCMMKVECAQALANSTNLSIRDQQITSSKAKKPEAGYSSEANSKLAPGQDSCAGQDSGGEAGQKTFDEKSMVLITGLPESGWSESDIIKLVQPFGTPSDIIQATEIRKVLVSMPNMEIAQEMVKAHAFSPAKIHDSEVKMIHLTQSIGLSTPVALYNLLMASVDPLESSVPVCWTCLLVISNVPNTPSCSSEVQKLVQRFGTIIKTLVLDNTVICEMATSAMALSVHKRFRTFPCVIQNNPLLFSRNPEIKPKNQLKFFTSHYDSSQNWVDHINTVNHTAACRDLRNKYPDWKPNLPRRSGRYGSRALWDPKDHSPSHSVSPSLSCSPTPSPPQGNQRVGPHRPHTGPYSPHHQPRHQHYTEHSHRLENSPSRSHQISPFSRGHWPEKRDRESSGGSSRSGVKRPYDDTSRHPFASKAGQSSKYGPLQSFNKTVKSGAKPGTKATKTSAKLPPAKKKYPARSDPTDRLVYLTGIPKDASEQEVTDLVGSFGKINNVTLMPGSEEESNKEGQKASVCMMKVECAQALANSTNLSIRDQQITSSKAKKPEAGYSSEANSKLAPGQDSCAGQDSAGGEAGQKTFDEKSMVLITGLPESGWSESDIIKLVQPFGTPSDIIQATEIRKVLVSMPNMEIAQEMVKAHAFSPAKIHDSEVKMIHLTQSIGLSTPVALYNLLMASVDPLESSVPVCWTCLLVISNVPNTPSCSSEVQKLVQRFGTVIKTLVLDNTVICEMATAAMAMSVHKRFRTFPCVIQNNPLLFSNKHEAKPKKQLKSITQKTPANRKGSQAAAAADEEETAHKENSESPLEGIERDGDGKDEKMKTVDEDKALGEDWSKEGEIKKDELTIALSDSLAAPDAKTEVDLDTDMRDDSAVETVTEAAEKNKGVNASTEGNDETPAGEETKPCSSDDKAASPETAMPELPKVTQEMVNALLVECRTRTASHPNNTAASTNGEQGKTQMETEPGEKAAEETKEPAKNPTEEVKKQGRETKEREARKEERDRRALEKEERAKRERERDERTRRERERRERKRAYGEGLSGSGSFGRSDGSKQSSGRDEKYNKTEAALDDFPFNMSDFVTVDEVGDLTDLPSLVPMEVTEGEEAAPTSVQQDTPGDSHMEVTTETTMLDSPAPPVKPDEDASESEAVTVPTALMLSDSQTHVPTCQQTEIPPETETTLDSTSEVEALPAPVPADSSSKRPATGALTSERERHKKEDGALSHRTEPKEEMVSDKTEEEKMMNEEDKTEEQEKMQEKEDKETGTPAVETGNHERCEVKINTEEESGKKKLKTMNTGYSLPPFDPSNPVGMEFLIPKTGFFCKVCNRFFSGTKEAEINHCKTLKHYENVQKFLPTTNTVNVTA